MHARHTSYPLQGVISWAVVGGEVGNFLLLGLEGVTMVTVVFIENFTSPSPPLQVSESHIVFF